MTEPAFGRFFLPGPTDVHPEVLAAMQRPMIGHRSGAMEQLLAGIAPGLGRLFRTSGPVIVGTASATGFMEMAVRNGVPSTGVLQDVAAFGAVVKEFDDVLLLVDAVTSLAGSPVEPDRWGLDFTFTGSQKALALPPGLALGVASERLRQRAKTLPGRGQYFDLVTFEEATRKSQPTNTPAISLLYALEVQLARVEREGGVEARWARHDAMRSRVEEWSAARDVAYVAAEGRRSWTISCLKVPGGKTAAEVVGSLKGQGWTIGSGYGALKDSTIRIGHMGDHTLAALEELLALIERALS